MNSSVAHAIRKRYLLETNLAITNSDTPTRSCTCCPGRPAGTHCKLQGLLERLWGDLARMHALALRGQAGQLAPGEETELESYRRIGRMLELMRSKARRSLARAGQAA